MYIYEITIYCADQGFEPVSHAVFGSRSQTTIALQQRGHTRDIPRLF